MSEPAMHVSVPASPLHLSVLRAAGTGLAAHLRFTFEEIDDLRIAVDEACTQLLLRRDQSESIDVVYRLGDGSLSVRASVTSAAPQPIPRDGLAWQILTALTEQVEEHTDDGKLVLQFVKRGGRQ